MVTVIIYSSLFNIMKCVWVFCVEEIATTTCINVWETFAAKAAETKTSATQRKSVQLSFPT